MPEAGFHSRGYLPHLKVPGAAYFVTFRLADSLPRSVVANLKARRKDLLARMADEQQSPTDRRRNLHAWYAAEVDAVLDSHSGIAHLRDARVADMVAGALRYIPGSYWLLPLLAGLALSIPLVYLTSVAEIGLRARRCGLFVIPSETQGLPILRRVHEVMSARAAGEHPALRGDGGGMESIERLIQDRTVAKLHLALLRDAPSTEGDRQQNPALLEIARRGELAAVTSKGWSALLSDPSSVAALHRRQRGSPSMPIRG